MVEIKITIDDANALRLKEAILAKNNYEEDQEDETEAQFALRIAKEMCKKRLINFVKQVDMVKTKASYTSIELE